MRVSIHQPQYIPWLGYFFKILHSDIFVLFDTVQYPRGKHFGNRNQIKTAQGAQWLTVPVLNRSDLLPYTAIQLDPAQPWAQKHWRTLELSYAQAPHFQQYASALRALYLDQSWQTIAALDHALLQFCLDALHIPTRILPASTLTTPRGDLPADAYIFAILSELGADHYISGQGAGSQRYIEPETFASRGIQLSFYDFVSPTYPQTRGDFIPDLSILDILFNCGDHTRSLLETSGHLR